MLRFQKEVILLCRKAFLPQTLKNSKVVSEGGPSVGNPAVENSRHTKRQSFEKVRRVCGDDTGEESIGIGN